MSNNNNHNRPQRQGNRNNNQRFEDQPIRHGGYSWFPVGVDKEIEYLTHSLRYFIRQEAGPRYASSTPTGGAQSRIAQRLRLGAEDLLDGFKATVDEILKLWELRPSPEQIEAIRSASRNEVDRNSVEQQPPAPEGSPEAPEHDAAPQQDDIEPDDGND